MVLMEICNNTSYYLDVKQKARLTKKVYKEETERIAFLIRRKILSKFRSIREFAMHVNFPYTHLSRLVTGTARMSLDQLFMIAEGLGEPIWQLLSEEPLIPLSKYQEMLPTVQERFKLVPRVSPAACGTSGIIPSAEVKEWLAFEESFLRQFKNPLLTTAQGDSMEPVIYDGDLLLIDRNEEKRLHPDRRALYLINLPETLEEIAITVKRVTIAGKQIFIIPINPDYPILDIDIDDKNLLDIILGEVVWIGRKIERR